MMRHVGNDVPRDAVNNVIFDALNVVWLKRKPKQRNTPINRRSPINKHAYS